MAGHAMKKLLFIVGILILAYLSFIFIFKKDKPNDRILGEVAENKINTKPTKASSIEFQYEGDAYTASWIEVDDIDNLILIPNFAEKKLSAEIAKSENCKVLTSAGFYTKDENPVGYFLSDGYLLRPWSKNNLFDGIFSVNDFGIPRITREVPIDPLVLALQTGPVLIENASPVTLKIKNDKPSRRVITTVSGGNILYFIVIYDKESLFSGPYLADLPQIISILVEKMNLSIADAINLDGGTASAFISSEISLSEAVPVGAFFCIKSS